VIDPAGVTDAAAALAFTHEWFEWNSGWAPPDPATLADWLADDVCRCPDDCLVAPASWCEHGLATWDLVLAELRDPTAPAEPPEPPELPELPELPEPTTPAGLDPTAPE